MTMLHLRRRLGRLLRRYWKNNTARKPPIYDRRVKLVEHWSASLGVPRRFYIYLPPEVGSGLIRRAPVVYFLRGHEREWINPWEDSSRGGRQNVIDIYEQLRAAGSIGPLILVFPGVTSTDGAIHGLAVNLRAPELARDNSIGSGRFEDYLVQDLIPYIDQHYPTLAHGRHRGIDGFSLGGFMSVKLALQYPDLFTTVGAYDGLYFWDASDHPATVAATDRVLDNPLFDPAFGRPRDSAFIAKNSPLVLLRQSGRLAAQLRWLIEYGPRSGEPNDSNFHRGERLVQLINALDGRNELQGEVREGRHSWRNADEHARRSLPLHWNYLSKAGCAGTAAHPQPDSAPGA
ncbi:MAG: esterase [Herpetosiphonaceae bacterium]|nr:MAG: esterase [Herpetosiphonaceae bacterium]